MQPPDRRLVTEQMLNDALTGLVLSGGGGGQHYPMRVGKTHPITRSGNSTGMMGGTAGTEYAIGLALPAVTVDRVGLQVTAAGTAGSTMRIGLRPIDLSTFLPGAPVVDAAVSIATIQDAFATFTAVALAGGLYALTWTRIGDTGNTSTMQRGTVELTPWLVGLAAGTAAPATGHGPAVTTLNTGITGALPSTCAYADQGTNLENGTVPAITLRRSA